MAECMSACLTFWPSTWNIVDKVLYPGRRRCLQPFIWHLNVVTLSIYWCFWHIHLALMWASYVNIILDRPFPLIFITFLLNLYFEYQRLCWRNFGPIGDRIQWKFFNKLLHSNKHCLNLLKKIESENMNKHFSVSFVPPLPHHVF